MEPVAYNQPLFMHPPFQELSYSSPGEKVVFIDIPTEMLTREPPTSVLIPMDRMIVSSPPSAAGMRDLLLFALREFDRPETPIRNRMARNFERYLGSLVAAEIARQFPADEKDLLIGRRTFADLIAWARSDHDVTPSVADLARYCGLGMRALQKNFLRHLDTSPAEFLRNLRLEKARELITRDGLGVTRAALEAGFVHLGHFSAAYFGKYGERPATTTARRDKKL